MSENSMAGASNGGELVVDTLVRLGCAHVFNITGLGMHSLAAALFKRKSEIGYVSHVNETNLALMAQGYARQTRAPAFCFVYHASGTALALMSLTTAWADHAPLVLVTSGDSRTASGRDQYAAIPRSALEIGSQFTKWSMEVPSAARIPEMLARAYSIAAAPPMGPVHLSIPADVYDEIVTEPIARSDFGRTCSFGEDCADELGLARIAELIKRAEQPVLLAGSEVGQLGAVQPLISLSELLGAPVVIEDLPSYLSFPTSHPQFAGTIGTSRDVLATADACLSIGFEFTPLGSIGEKSPLAASIPIAVLSVDRLHATKQLWPDIAVCGHPRPSLLRLTQILNAAGVSSELRNRRLSVCCARQRNRQRKIAAVRNRDRGSSPVAPLQIINEIATSSCNEWTIVQVGSTSGFDFESIYDIANPEAFHGLSGKASAQGWGVPVATGIQLAQRARRVITFVGDGNLMFSASSLWAAAKNRLPMIFVVANNSGWASVANWMTKLASADARSGDEMGWTFGDAPIDYVGFANSLGLRATRAITAEQLGAALASASADDHPWLIEVLTEFDSGSNERYIVDNKGT